MQIILILYYVILISVGTAPKVIEILKETTVISGEDATLTCKIAPGDPVASITWHCEERELRSSPKYVVSYDNQVATLVVKNADLNDVAKYRCEAENKIGRCETQAKLIVHSKCCILIYPDISNHSVCYAIDRVKYLTCINFSSSWKVSNFILFLRWWVLDLQ